MAGANASGNKSAGVSRLVNVLGCCGFIFLLVGEMHNPLRIGISLIMATMHSVALVSSCDNFDMVLTERGLVYQRRLRDLVIAVLFAMYSLAFICSIFAHDVQKLRRASWRWLRYFDFVLMWTLLAVMVTIGWIGQYTRLCPDTIRIGGMEWTAATCFLLTCYVVTVTMPSIMLEISIAETPMPYVRSVTRTVPPRDGRPTVPNPSDLPYRRRLRSATRRATDELPDS
jgi:hypothetical protein